MTPADGRDFIAPMVRVSTLLQAQKGYSLDHQRDFLFGLIDREGFATRPDLVLEDDGFEGDDWNRPSIQQGLDWIREGRVKGLAFLDTDRFARDVEGGLRFIRRVRDLNGALLFGDIGLYRHDAEFRVQLQLKLILGEYQKHKMKGLSRASVLRKIRDNKQAFGGNAPYGYRFKGKLEGSRGEIVIVPEHAAVVRAIFAKRDAGMSLRAILRDLRARAVPPPKSNWNCCTLSKILKERAYLGQWHYNKRESVEPKQIRSAGPRHRRRSSGKLRPEAEWIPLAIEPIIRDAALFDRVQALGEKNVNVLGGRPSDRYMLKGLVWCGVCGKRCNGQFWKRKPEGKQTRYICANRDRATGAMLCAGGFASVCASRLEDTVWDAVMGTLSDGPTLEKLIRRHERELAAAHNPREIAKLQARQEELKRREFKARRAALDAPDQETAAFYESEVRDTLAQRNEIQRELARIAPAMTGRVDIPAIVAAAKRGIAKATRLDKQELLRNALQRVVYANGVVEIELLIPLTGGENCQQGVTPANSFFLLKLKRRVA